jgi:ElaB/YqjD/DUF883 family membrane-anchored ribosome-binding protein
MIPGYGASDDPLVGIHRWAGGDRRGCATGRRGDATMEDTTMQGQASARSKSVETELEGLESRAKAGANEARVVIEAFARENPRTAVAIALGVGFVLGGGLTPRLLFGIGALAARNFARDYAKNQIGSMTRNALGIDGDGADEDADERRRAQTQRERPSQA